MNNNNNASKLIGHLEQEINWIEALNILLAEEKNVLSTRQFNQLEELAEKKQVLSTKLEESAKQRIDLINDTHPESSPSLSLQIFLKNCSVIEANKINTLNTKLIEQLSICRDLNTINGQVIASNIHTRQQIVNALSGNKVEATSVYTSNGDMTSSNSANHHQKA